VSQQSTNRSFDDLARAVAEGSISRRGALKLLAGSALAALIPSRALADDCVRVCHVPFNREKRECDEAKARTLCVSRRERRRHLDEHRRCDCRGSCRNCLTPACQDFGVECTANEQCCSGVCASSEPDMPRICNDPCPEGRDVLINGTCAVPCTTISMPPSGADCVPPDAPSGTPSNCAACSAEADTGQGFCRGENPQGSCPQGTINCPVGQFCVDGTCFGRCNPELP
jgi:hypothetical protein